MKLLTILLFIVLLSSNYVMSQTRCPKNGIQTDDGACFYLSKEHCPLPWKNIGVIENDADYAIISDLLRTTKTKERVCMSIYDSDMKKILNRQPKYMKKLREENQILLDKPIQNDESLHIAFKMKDVQKTTVITVRDSSENDIYFGKIEISYGQLKVSANTEIETAPKVRNLPFSYAEFNEIDIRFTSDKLQVIDSSNHEKLIEIDLSLKSKYSAHMISIENIEVYQLEHHDMKCKSEETYSTHTPVILRENDTSLRLKSPFERTIIENFNLKSDTEVHEMTSPKVNKWAENIIFHLIGHHSSSQFNFEIYFVKSEGGYNVTNFEYKYSQGTLTYNYQRYTPFFGGGYFQWGPEDTVITILPSSESYTFGMSENGRLMHIFIESGGKIWENPPIYHPCLKNDVMQKDCIYKKDRIHIKSNSSYITGFRYLKKENLAKYCFSDYWIFEMTTKVPYQSDCGTEKNLNICRIRRNVYSQSYQLLSTESSISDEQDETLTSSKLFSNRKYGTSKPVTVVKPFFLLVICLFLNLVNVIFECVQG